MPLYEYLCESCGRRSEVLQRLTEAPLTVCPHCGGNLKKLVSAPAFQFKGSGWYVTDYARGGGKPGEGEKADKAGEKERSQKSEGGSGETAAAAADTKTDAPATKPAAGDAGKGSGGGSTPPPASSPKGD
jgi:putative FmdB family regulatory protein